MLFVCKCGAPRTPLGQIRNVVEQQYSYKTLPILDEIASSASGVFDADAATTLVATGAYRSLIHNTRLLKYVDLEQLATNDEKLCFYGNVLTLMSVHASLYEVERKSDGQSPDCEASHDWTMSPLECVLMQRKVTYWIGQLGLVS